jgi:hypothetical protein
MTEHGYQHLPQGAASFSVSAEALGGGGDRNARGDQFPRPRPATRYAPQNAEMASCRPCKVENPRPPRHRGHRTLSPEPRRSCSDSCFDPGTPANLGDGSIKMLMGVKPTGIVALTAFVSVSLTDTVLEEPFVMYAFWAREAAGRTGRLASKRERTASMRHLEDTPQKVVGIHLRSRVQPSDSDIVLPGRHVLMATRLVVVDAGMIQPRTASQYRNS